MPRTTRAPEWGGARVPAAVPASEAPRKIAKKVTMVWEQNSALVGALLKTRRRPDLIPVHESVDPLRGVCKRPLRAQTHEDASASGVMDEHVAAKHIGPQ